MNDPVLFSPLKCLACWQTDAEDRRLSASGGMATALGRYVIRQLGGSVCGVAYSDGLKPVFKCTDRIEDLENFKGSKYVQSELPPATVEQMREELSAGRTVLFIGLPCQVAAIGKLCSGLAGNLVTVDLICHGVSPYGHFRDELDYLRKRHGLPEPSEVRFRSNDERNFHLSLWDGDRCIFDRPAYKEPYFSAFLQGIGLKEACYNCRFAKPGRTGDITLGDFIGLGKTVHFAYDEKNVSVMTANTGAGLRFVDEFLASSPEIFSVERDYGERLEYAPSLRSAVRRPKSDALFRMLVGKVRYAYAVRIALLPAETARRMLNSYVRMKRRLGINGPLRIRRKNGPDNL